MSTWTVSPSEILVTCPVSVAPTGPNVADGPADGAEAGTEAGIAQPEMATASAATAMGRARRCVMISAPPRPAGRGRSPAPSGEATVLERPRELARQRRA